MMALSNVEITNLKDNLVMLAETICYCRKVKIDYENVLELYADIYQELANAGHDSYLINISSKYKINF